MIRPLLVVLLLLAGCGAEEPDPVPARNAAPAADPARAAADLFDADRAWRDLLRQVDLGPRVPGSAAARAAADLLAAELAASGGEVSRDRFSYRSPAGETWELVNVLGRFGPPGPGRLLLVAHWDTRPWADRDPVPGRREFPIPGANDGASGVAVLLEVSRHLSAAALPRGVDILFVDGEDLGTDLDPEGYFRGSRRFAGRGVEEYERAMVVDMVGDADLRIPVEPYSLQGAPEVVDWVWTRAERLGVAAFVRDIGPPVLDDHIPLLEAGLPAVDLIDFDYSHWHTQKDDARAVAPRSLAAVGRVVLSLALVP